MVSVKNLRSSIFEATGAAKAASTNDSLCPSLSYQTRVIGFCACFIAGCVLTLLSFTNFVALINGNPVPFVCMYTLGNVLALASSMFLVSPKRQWNSMLDKKRRWTSLVYVVCLVLALVFVFVAGIDWSVRLIILLCCIIAQFLAAVWYSLSYIPYGRATVIKYGIKYGKQYCC